MNPLNQTAELLTKYTALTVLVFIAIAVFIFWAVRRIIAASLRESGIPESESEVEKRREESRDAVEKLMASSDSGHQPNSED